MRLSRLALIDFRSYPDLRLDLPKGTTILLGKNGAGKTNIVEAIRYLSTLTSHRVATDGPMIRSGCERAIIGGTVEKAGRELGLEVTIVSGGANRGRFNLSPARPRDIAGILRTVVFSPEDIDLVKGDPSGRRRLLDEACVAMAPRLAGDLSDYDRVVRQRGALLKSIRGRGSATSALDVWDEKLAHLGAKIMRARADTIEALRPHTTTAYADVATGGARCTLRYASSIGEDDAIAGRDEAELEGALLRTIEREKMHERERGVCLVGPHRDDLIVSIGELPARGYASHGESWSAALALRLGVYALLTATGGPDSGEDGEPILILDDVFAELDGVRRAALADRAMTARQVIVTAAVGADVPQALGGAIYSVDQGTVTSDG
jgi:DNA replication and repair protein RecF